jgi:uncharacterized protein YndB with AHSA1/START domain
MMNEYGEVLNPTTVRMERLLSGSIDEVWSYITDPDKRRTWLAFGAMELKVGGKVVLAFDFSFLTSEAAPERFRAFESGHTLKGHVTVCEPPHLLSFTWNEKEGKTPSEVRFELVPQGEKTLLILTHTKLPGRGDMVNVSGGWHTHLDILDDRLNKREPRKFWNTLAQMQDEYKQRIPEAAPQD